MFRAAVCAATVLVAVAAGVSFPSFRALPPSRYCTGRSMGGQFFMLSTDANSASVTFFGNGNEDDMQPVYTKTTATFPAPLWVYTDRKSVV